MPAALKQAGSLAVCYHPAFTLMPTPDQTRVTYFYDRLRAVGVGVLETAQQTFLVWIAIRVFQTGPTIKAVVSSGPMLGLLLSLVVVSALNLRAARPSSAAAVIQIGRAHV